MARPSIGIFGALFAVGSVLAWKWAQSRNAGARGTPRELNRWEGEGGSVAPASRTRSAVPGEETVGGTPEAWHFPRS